MSSQTVTPPASAKLIVHGHIFADFEVGRIFEHRQRRTVLESDNSVFTTLTLHYNPRYLDREFAKAAGYRDIVVNPLLVFNTVFGISVEDLSEGGGPFLGVEDLEFGEPVHAGDTLRARSTVLSARLSAKHERYGVVAWNTRGFNQANECVIVFNRTNLVRRER
jgi:acyl dehydratase